MDALSNMDLFVRVVKNSALAAAGREVGLSPARVTARINDLEQHYGVRLLNRSTRNVTLTEAGEQFYQSCKRVLIEFDEAERVLQKGKAGFCGSLKITSTSDLGQQVIAPLIDEYSKKHPDVSIYLHLSDSLTRMQDGDFDLAIRYGVLEDSSLVAKRIAKNYRVLCASPEYLKKHGIPKVPEELNKHACLAMIRSIQPLSTWYFEKNNKLISVPIEPSRASNDGAQVRRWTLDGAGISLKSYLDIRDDIKNKRLVTILDDYHPDFVRKGVHGGADLHVIYQSRDFLPERIRSFIDDLSNYLK